MSRTPFRFAFYLVMAAIAVWIIVDVVTDPSGWFSDKDLTSYTSAICAPLILVIVGRWVLRELRGGPPPLDRL